MGDADLRISGYVTLLKKENISYSFCFLVGMKAGSEKVKMEVKNIIVVLYSSQQHSIFYQLLLLYFYMFFMHQNHHAVLIYFL